MKALVRSPIPANPQLQRSVAAWESFLFTINQQIHQSETDLNNQLTRVKNGAHLSSLPPVSIPILPALPGSSMLLENDDPAIIASYSSASKELQMQNQMVSIAQASAAATQKPLTALMQAAPRTAEAMAKVPSVTSVTFSLQSQSSLNQIQRENSLTKPQSAWLSVNNRSGTPTIPEIVTSTDTLLSTSQPANATSQQPKNSYDKIINRLLTMFPHYSRAHLTDFIKEVRSANGGSLSGLVYDEIINRVADLILDHQDKTKVQFVPSTLQQPASLVHQRPSSDLGTSHRVPTASRESLRPSTLSAARSARSQPWKPVKAQTASQWHTFDDEPCIICHEDLTPDTMCVLQCKHQFHQTCIKKWLRENSTCPTCRVHALLPEDFPELSGMIKNTQTYPF
ncbi:E3 ubiquitin-protein ligase DZIP3-like isoform X2 [Rhincodon typus]|uniref:E3 ubiquitin-protein ligase DZIP3-like isoform X2 n=1 Tax=Rhincodon typus TaxID=259920 RepID=UPI00202DC320|nr:E3 ubiquitin-protein ligase DZIP3-like isoform X2 [Rhincodon typus]